MATSKTPLNQAAIAQTAKKKPDVPKTNVIQLDQPNQKKKKEFGGGLDVPSTALGNSGDKL